MSDVTENTEWLDLLSDKAIVCAAGVSKVVPVAEGTLVSKGASLQGATHEVHLSQMDVTEPQDMMSFIDDGHGKGVRAVLGENAVYRWVSTHKVQDNLIFLVEDVSQHIERVKKCLENAAEMRVLIKGDPVKVER